MGIEEGRQFFNGTPARALAREVGIPESWAGGASPRFSYFADERRLLVVAGQQEGSYTDLAFALGLSQRQGRKLVLVLPRAHAFATLQRAPWFAKEAQPDVYVYDQYKLDRVALPSQQDTVARAASVKPPLSPSEELRAAATPMHLGKKSSCVVELTEWATRHAQLDSAHTQKERAWHCMGQKVLSITSTNAGISITAGIHYSKPGQKPVPTTVATGGTLSSGQLRKIKDQIAEGIAARLGGPPPIHRPDEHWLQSVIRSDPSLVGVEQPALREVPAFRPSGDGTSKSWGRGYVDLMGLDGHGDIRIVETKLAENSDDLLIFQGLDYYVWAQAYRAPLASRLGASPRAGFEIHYVIGDRTDGKIHLSRHAKPQVLALDPKIRWRFQTVHRWFDPAGVKRSDVKALPPGKVP